jgi:hypothetical protein
VWQSRKDFEVDFFRSYRISRLQRGKKIVPIGSTIIVREAKRHKEHVPRKVAAALSVLDDLNLDAIFWFQSLIALLLKRVDTDKSAFHRSIFALLMRVTQDAMVIRNLICSGFDVQARNLLRSMEEHVDTIYYLCLKPEASEEFVHADDDVKANQFWYAHIRGSRKVIDRILGERLKAKVELAELQQFRLEERKMLSTAHHPSYMAVTIPFFVPYERVNVTKFIFGFPSEFSYRTGMLLFYILAELCLYLSFLNKDMKEIIEYKGRDILQTVVRKGQNHLAIMLLHLVRNWRSPLFSRTAAMVEFLDGLRRDHTSA